MNKANISSKIFIFIFSTFFLVSSFQNCSQSSVANEFNTNVDQEISKENTNSGDINSKRIESIHLQDTEVLEISLGQFIFSDDSGIKVNQSVNSENNLKINLSNGEMRTTNTEGDYTSSVRLCLKKDELVELNTIIETAKLCDPGVVSSSATSHETVCTQEYIYPYAKLYLSSNEQIKLGEKAGCTLSLDLCSEHKKTLNGFISYLKNQLNDRRCL